MKHLIFYFFILVSFEFISCNDVGYNDAKTTLNDNKDMLSNIVEQMYYKKNFTFLNVRKVKSNEIHVRIEKEDSAYNSIIVEKDIQDTEIDKISKEFCAKTNSSDSIKFNKLFSILNWMLKNNLEIIRVKTPEYNHLDVKLGHNGALRFQTDYNRSPDLITLDPIEKNWFFVIYK